MQNVVSLPPDRLRPQRALGVPRGGARILFFTGVRYCRDEAEAPTRPDRYAPCHGLSRIAWGGPNDPASRPLGAEQGYVGEPTQSHSGSERMLDAAAH